MQKVYTSISAVYSIGIDSIFSGATFKVQKHARELSNQIHHSQRRYLSNMTWSPKVLRPERCSRCFDKGCAVSRTTSTKHQVIKHFASDSDDNSSE